jgi:hypothetical protein
MKYILILMLLGFTVLGEDKPDHTIMFKGIEYNYSNEDKEKIINDKFRKALDDLDDEVYKVRAKAIAYLKHEANKHYYSEEDEKESYYHSDEDHHEVTDEEPEEEYSDDREYQRRYTLLIMEAIANEYKSNKHDIEWKLNSLDVLKSIYEMFWEKDIYRIKAYNEKYGDALKRLFKLYQREVFSKVLVL